MNEIYLISSNNHRDSINLKLYATDDEELKFLCVSEFKKWFSFSGIESVKISFKKKQKIVIIYYYEHNDVFKTNLEHKIYYTFKSDTLLP